MMMEKDVTKRQLLSLARWLFVAANDEGPMLKTSAHVFQTFNLSKSSIPQLMNPILAYRCGGRMVG